MDLLDEDDLMPIGDNNMNENLMMLWPNALIRQDCKDQWETDVRSN